ncbi:MAG: hypothetical protein L3K09_04190 [Thermoplasmata archaeon]|nr:hypothetical protein [Thermoplasmata archaeon]
MSAPLFAAVAVMMLLAPTTVGASPSLVTMKAPYKKATAVLTNPKSSSGCASTTQPVLAFFNKTNGIGGFSDNATAPKCTTSYNFAAMSEGQMVITLPLKAVATGTYTVTATWDTIIASWANITSGSCKLAGSFTSGWCNVTARAFVYGSAFLLDKTTHVKTALTTKWPGNFTYVWNYTTCSTGTCASKTSPTLTGTEIGNFPWIWDWQNVKLSSTDHYVLVMTIFGGASASITSFWTTITGASANAQMNSATGGNEEKLLSVTIA